MSGRRQLRRAGEAGRARKLTIGLLHLDRRDRLGKEGLEEQIDGQNKRNRGHHHCRVSRSPGGLGRADGRLDIHGNFVCSDRRQCAAERVDAAQQDGRSGRRLQRGPGSLSFLWD